MRSERGVRVSTGVGGRRAHLCHRKDQPQPMQPRVERVELQPLVLPARAELIERGATAATAPAAAAWAIIAIAVDVAGVLLELSAELLR